MTIRKLTLATATLAITLTACATAYALSHPNFQAADASIQNAQARIRAAQQENGLAFGGHADRAAQLLEQARQELSIADEYHRGVRR